VSEGTMSRLAFRPDDRLHSIERTTDAEPAIPAGWTNVGDRNRWYRSRCLRQRELDHRLQAVNPAGFLMKSYRRMGGSRAVGAREQAATRIW